MKDLRLKKLADNLVNYSVRAKKGDKVKKGDVLGKAGLLPIESADGVHIHLETKVEDKTVSPVDALNLM